MDEKININQANEEELSQLSGIGMALAARIIAYRETVHPFEEVIELTAVPGISERMVRNFADQLTVEPQTAISVVEPEATMMLDEIDTAVVVDTPSNLSPAPNEIAAAGDFDEQDVAAEIGATNEAPELVAAATPVTPPESIPPSNAPAKPSGKDRPTTRRPTFVQEQPMENNNVSQPAVDVENGRSEAAARRRGCFTAILGAVIGAVLGTALTLAILAAVNNGSLQYGQASQRLQTQLDQTNQSLEALNQSLENNSQQLDALATRADTMGTEQSTLNTDVEAVKGSLESAQSDLATAQGDLETLAETAVLLDERIDTVSKSAETFDNFLNGMRDLLVSLQGDAPTATPDAKDTTATPTAVGTTEQTATATPNPTRTPRPTATPITLPTATPGQQP